MQHSDLQGFGRLWQGLIPGRLAIVGNSGFMADIEYISETGAILSFTADSYYDTNIWTFHATQDDARMKVSMVSVPTANRRDYFIAPSVQNGAAEMRIDMGQGGSILFRRAGPSYLQNDFRYLVPIERDFPSGYKLFYDYGDTWIYPNVIRDNLGRSMSVTWTDSGAPFDEGRVITGIVLPDSSRMDYVYASAPSIVNQTIQNRLQSATRRSSTGVSLWSHTYLYEDGNWPHALTGIVDQNGARLSTFSYSPAGQAISTEQAGGVNHHTMSFFEQLPYLERTMTVATNPLGKVDTYEFYRRDLNRYGPRLLTGITGQASTNVPASTQSWNYYDSDLSGSVDRNGNITVNTLDNANHRPTAITEAQGSAAARTTSFGWHPTLDLPMSEARPGLTTSYTYSPEGRMLTRTQTDTTAQTIPYSTSGQARTWTYTWVGNGRLASVNGPKPLTAGKDDLTAFGYDAANNLATVTNGLSQVTHFDNYDLNGRPGTMTDANGIVTAFVYDPLGRTSTVTVRHPTVPAQNATTAFDYDVEGRVTGITLPLTDKLIMDYDLAGRLTAVRNAAGEKIAYTLNAMGGVLTETTQRADATIRNTVSRTFDELNRMLTETLGPNRTTTYQYDPNGNATQVVSARSAATTLAFDGIDRLASTLAPDTGTASNSYDVRDNVIAHTDAVAVQTTFVRDGFGEVIREVSPDRGTSTYYYDAAGDMTASIDGRGQRVNYTRDILGRVTLKAPVGVTGQNITYTYDTAGITGSFGVGRLSSMVDTSGTTLFSYDHRGNLLVKRQKLGATTAANLTYAYDLADRIVTITYPSGRIVNYIRDSKGRVSSVTTKASGTGTLVTLASAITYEAFGALKSLSYGNGLTLTQDWGTDNRLYAKSVKTSGGANVWSLTYAYDNDDNITGMTDLVDGMKSLTFGYDTMDRLIRTDGNLGGTTHRYDYLSDANGNRTRVEARDVATQPSPTSFADYARTVGTNRLASTGTGTGQRSITYDARGNTSGETRPGSVTATVAYDAYARLAGYTRTGDPTQTNVYNGLDDRVKVTSGSIVRSYLYDGKGRLLGDYGTSATNVMGEFIWLSPNPANDNPFGGGDGAGGWAPLAVTSGTSSAPIVQYLHGDQLGKPVLTTSSTGAIVTAVQNYAQLQYPGQIKTLADLSYNRYRDYDPSTGRYVQADPIGLGGGNNPFNYAIGNPLRFRDSSGKCPARKCLRA